MVFVRKNTMKAPFARFTAGIATLGLALAAFAAPPAGHPSPEAAMQMMHPDKPIELSRSGTVVSHIDANEYTYLEVNENGSKTWLAAPRVVLKDGDKVRFSDGVAMRDFYSKMLKRTFPAITFVDAVEVAKAR